MMLRISCGFVVLCALTFAGERGEEIRLWSKGAPGSEGVTAKEVSQPAHNAVYQNAKLPGNFTEVHYPSVYVFLPPKEKANGTAVLVVPGGGHRQVVIEKEGWEIADWLNEHGVAAFVLKYRLARAEGSKYTVEEHALGDTARAMRLLRSRAKEWGVNPGLIGVMGFSAGGELAALIETRFDAGDAAAGDPIERVSSRPDFAVVVYPGFRRGLIHVPENAPPTFLVCADDDRSHIYATVDLYMDLFERSIPSEMHIYARGGHGFALRPSDGPVDTWEDRLVEWMVDQKLLKQ
jgi:acetyl esterase/lipase